MRELGSEQCFHGDHKSERHHFFGHVADVALAPIACERQRLLDHRVCVLNDTLAMKCRLREAALAAPQFALARQQALAEQTRGSAFYSRALVEFLRLADD